MSTAGGPNAELPKYLADREQAKQRDNIIRVVAVLLAAAFIAAAACLQRPINQQRRDLQLVAHTDVRNVPPKYVWMTAMLGSFRGLAVNYLWIRAEELKQEGKYYESAQLADWITTLQPRFAAVWTNRAWDLAYNISVGTHTPEERWQWVYNGIRLLRDRGIPNNPRTLNLYRELSWTFFHKIGEMSDNMHWYYKRQLASMMENVLGRPPAGDTQAVIDAFRPIAEAPQRLSDLIAAQPEVAPLVESLKAAGVDVAAETTTDRRFHPLEETFFVRYAAMMDQSRETLEKAGPESAGGPDAKLRETIAKAPKPAWDALLAYLRAKVLREQYRMDPAYMFKLMTSLVPGKPGLPVPLDWRTPEAHTIYWSRYGVDEGAKVKNVSEIDMLNTDRNTVYALMKLCQRGRLLFVNNRKNPFDSVLRQAPDLRLVEPMHQMYLALGKRHAEKDEKVGETAGEMLKSGHVNTVEESVVWYYIRGQVSEANRYYTYLRENYKEFDGKTKVKYQLDLESFITAEIKGLTETYNGTVNAIDQLLADAMFGLASGDAEVYVRGVERARMVHKAYMKEHDDEEQGRMRILPFDDMQAATLYQFMINVPSVLARAAVWQSIDPRLKQKVYDVPGLLDAVTADCKEENVDPAKAFPEPAGMAEYREANKQLARPEDPYKSLFDPNAPIPEPKH